MRRDWEFDFAPLDCYREGDRVETDFVVATEADVDPAVLVAALGGLSERIEVTPLLSAHPLYWSRVELGTGATSATVAELVTIAGVGLRYVTSSVAGSQRLVPAADFSRARPRRGRGWPVRAPREVQPSQTPGGWFLGPLGANVDRDVCGTGAGTRLAVIDNDAREIDSLDLESQVLIGVHRVPRASSHGALAVGWAVGTAPRQSGKRFFGVAPDASARLYCVPKPGSRLFDVPIAIVRAVDDGADVVLCATYLDGETSPLWEDALEFARRLGRYGRGSAVVIPSSRELSSPGTSLHASLSLGPAEPASDPRVFCVGPSSCDGGWFLWRDRKGKLHPFANRGPALRWLAPGDDMPYPFSDVERPIHAESSGAAAVAAGVLLLVLAQNPELTVDELEDVVTRTVTPLDPAHGAASRDLADARDLLPTGIDADGHNVKHGYGRMDAALAVAAARDPVAATLAFMGERRAALLWSQCAQRFYGAAFGRAAARLLLRDPSARHALAACARALRVWSLTKESPPTPSGALMRQILVALRLFQSSRWGLVGQPGVAFQEELAKLTRALLGKDPRLFERDMLGVAASLQLRRPHLVRRVKVIDDASGAPVATERDLSLA